MKGITETKETASEYFPCKSMTLFNLRKALLVASFCAFGATLEERPPALEHTHAIPPGSRFCVDTSPSSYTCSGDPMSIRKQFDPSTYHEMDIGLPQRVDGTELERKGIRQVLDAMDAYYYGEVLSNPEYREVRQYWYVRDKATMYVEDLDLRIYSQFSLCYPVGIATNSVLSGLI